MAICQGKGKHLPEARGFRAGVYELDFLPCLMGLAATAAVRLSRSLIQFLSSFCCLETMGAVILWFLSLGDIHDCYAMSTLNKLSQIIKISLKFFECNGLPSLVCRNAPSLPGGSIKLPV
jgi:hypothetical protein